MTSIQDAAATEALPYSDDEPLGSIDPSTMPGRSVEDLQRRLGEIGWPVAVDGVYGKSTFESVSDFQRGFAWWDLVVDGYAGAKTWDALDLVKRNSGLCSLHFAFREFKSRGDGWIKVSRVLVRGLEAYRDLAGRPVRVVSGYRDPDYNARVGGARNSQHLYGNAVDLDEVVPWQKVAALQRFSGIGIQGSNGLIRHVDVRHVGPNTTGGTPVNPTHWIY